MDQKQLQQEEQELWVNKMSLPIQISAVLFALDLVFLQTLVQTSSLTGWKTCSLLLFAIALPCLAANVFVMFQMRITKTVLPGKSWLFLIIQVAGYLASFAGVWASIMDTSWWIGLLFVGVAICVVAFCAKANQDIERIRTGKP